MRSQSLLCNLRLVGEERVMNEADNPYNGDLIEPLTTNSLQPKPVNCPFDSVGNTENTAVRQLPLLASAQNKQSESQILSEENALQQDWVAEPEREKQELIDAEFKKLLELNEELRSANNGLYDQVEELKAVLTESEMALQWQKKRASVTESMLNQQTQELTATQEQVKSLFQQLETAVQTVQRQESLIENYKGQLEMSQQRLAQLEREFTLIQSSHNEQSHLLLQSENACRELRTRLMRQQRQTLQFKAALEKCLETPVPSYDSSAHNDISTRQRVSKHSSISFTQAQPIRPWSAEPESLTESVDNSCRNHQGESSILDPASNWDTSQPEEASTPTQPVDTPETEIETVSSSDLASLEEQLDGVIQMFFVANPMSTAPPPPEQEAQDNTLASETIWETSVIPLTEDETQTSQTPSTHDFSEETEDFWIEVSQSPSLEFSETNPPEPLINNLTNLHSPSPLIYPQRPPKKRKSLAAVELPNFRSK
jgi:hypothetical protein